MMMPERKYSAANSYRYGFNGKENDNEVKEIEGSQQDYGMRVYDPRVGKFLSVDPITEDYPELTPYQFASNRPIDGIDLDGLEYLSSIDSKIDIGLNWIQFNGVTLLSGSIALDPDNVTPNTQGALRNQPMNKGQGGLIATFEHGNFQELKRQRDKYFILLTNPDASDVKAESIGQQEVESPRLSNNKAMQRDARAPVIPMSKGGAAKGDAIASLVGVTIKVIQGNQGIRMEDDFADAVKQIKAASNAINDFQFGLDNKLIDQKFMSNLGAFANFLLDGDEPVISFIGTDNEGRPAYNEGVDTELVKSFRKIKFEIDKRKLELKKSNGDEINK